MWEAIEHHLDLARCKLTDESPLFVATVDNGEYLPQHDDVPEPEGEEPLTAETLHRPCWSGPRLSQPAPTAPLGEWSCGSC